MVLDFISQTGEFLKTAQVRYIYWFLALFGSSIFLIQMIMVFLGFGGEDSGMDANGDGDVSFGEHADSGFAEFRFFSLRAVFAFITFFGWGGVLWGDAGWGGFFGAFASGIAMMFMTAILVFAMLKLQHSGNIAPRDLIGCSGTVYLSIPAQRASAGKVTVSVSGVTREVRALSDEELPTGTSVIIENMIDDKRYLVKKIS